MSLVQKLRSQWRVLLAELAKFGVVGVINTVVDFGIFNFLHFGPVTYDGRPIGPLTSQAIATLISATLAYFMNRHWTFKHRARTNLRREYSLFFILNLVGLAIMEVCIAGMRYGLDQPGALALNIAKFVGLVLGTLFRFWSYKRWVFLADGKLAVEGDEVRPAESGGLSAPESVRRR